MIAQRNLSCKIVSLRGKQAQIEISGKVIEIERETLPPKTKVGDELFINLLKPAQAKLNQKELAENILEEILNGK